MLVYEPSGSVKTGATRAVRVNSGGGERCQLPRVGCLDLITNATRMFTILRYT